MKRLTTKLTALAAVITLAALCCGCNIFESRQTASSEQVIGIVGDTLATVHCEVPVQHNWLWIGKDKRKIKVNVFGTPGTKVDVSLNAVSDLSLMYERDTVLRSTKTVKIPSRGMKTVSFDISTLESGFYQICLAADGIDQPTFNIGVDPEKIISPTDKPKDFDKFWAATLRELDSYRIHYKLEYVPEHSNKVRKTYKVTMKSIDGVTIGGILCFPVADGKWPVYIDYMGYGADVHYYDPDSNPQAIEFLVSVRDQGLFKEGQSRWIGRGLDSKHKFYYKGAFCDCVRAVDFICELPFADKSKIFARGNSQGGAFTLIAAALDKRIAAAAPGVPFLGDYPDYHKIVKWPMCEVFEAAAEQGISKREVLDMLRYFDVKNFTDRISCPVFMGFSLQDPICPPHTNFAEYNNIRSEKKYYCAPLCGHGIQEVGEWLTLRQEFFNEIIAR